MAKPKKVPKVDAALFDLVHLLRHGQSACRIVDGMPGEWPPGNLWTPDPKLVTCKACLCVIRGHD